MSRVYLIPSLLHDEGVTALPSYIIDAIRDCQVFFVENDRTTRRYFKRVWKEMVIDDYEWFSIGNAEEETRSSFEQKLKEGKNIGIVSEAGCPGVADPGQLLIAIAQERNVEVKPLVGPSSILLALMASGMNGQQFRFVGYLPIESNERNKIIKDLEATSVKENSTQIFIETPYRNNQIVSAILNVCKPSTRLCIAVSLTGPDESVLTKTIAQWKKENIDLHKKPAIFLISAT
jgi:16S rRNA (cytidine1402-2'-O)-methyltransferase